MLQWSHVFSDMVSYEAKNVRIVAFKQLQWSHVFSDMVSCYHFDIPVVELYGFNGAMSFQTW